MNTRNDAMDAIDSFIASDEKGMLITGVKNCDRHLLVMQYIEENYSNASVLFRIDSMDKINYFTPLEKQPIAGKIIKIGRNFYEFDAMLSRQTWNKTGTDFDFCVVFPVDCIVSSGRIDAIENMNKSKRIKKTFYCGYQGHYDYDNILKRYFSRCLSYSGLQNT